MPRYDSGRRLKYFFIIGAAVIALASLLASNLLIRKLADEERQKIEIWAEAGRALAGQDTHLNLSLILKILEGNHSIPVLLCDENGNIKQHRNIDLPERDPDAFLKKKAEVFKKKNRPIVIDIGDGDYQYLYYDDSILLKRLLVYPYIQLSVVFVFILIAFLALTATKRAEQNKLWVGLSKETAHQLGTPISSLIAWMEHLRERQTDPALLDEMQKDIQRLQTIAERFSKIGSNPSPTLCDIADALLPAVEYMQARISNKVHIRVDLPPKPAVALISPPLFAWVIENLIKNAVDAMDGQGEITIDVHTTHNRIRIDVADNGKGIAKAHFNAIFTPGYTTKARGWGLGLSLARRIIETSHKGKIFVKASVPGRGTTFRIELPKRAAPADSR